MTDAFKLNNDWLTQNIKGSKSTAKFIFLKLCDNASDEGYCWPSLSTVAEACACSKDTVRNSIKSFKDKNLVSVTERTRKNNSQAANGYQINIELLHELSAIVKTTPLEPIPPLEPSGSSLNHNKNHQPLPPLHGGCEKPSTKKRTEYEYSDEFMKLWNHEKTPRFARDASKKQSFIKWNKITRNGKDENAKKEIMDGWIRHVLKREHSGINVKYLDTFLNPKEEWWKKDWEIEAKPRPKQSEHITEPKGLWGEALRSLVSKGLLDEDLIGRDWKYIKREDQQKIINGIEQPSQQLTAKEEPVKTSNEPRGITGDDFNRIRARNEKAKENWDVPEKPTAKEESTNISLEGLYKPVNSTQFVPYHLR